MCWLVIKDKNKNIPNEYIRKAQEHNKHGYGLAYYSEEKQMVVTLKTLDFENFLFELSLLDDKEVIVHLRNATVGEVTISNTHPFKVHNGYMFHNGTIESFKYKTFTSDSDYLATILSSCSYNEINDIRPLVQNIVDDGINRLVFIENTGKITIFNEGLGITENSIWYSNDYHLKEEGWCRV